MSARTLPYRTPAGERFAVEPWFLHGNQPSELPSILDAWDYLTELHLVRRMHVDGAGVRTDCGLPPQAPLQVCIRVRPSTSLIRRILARCPVGLGDGRPLSLDVVLPGADLAGALTLETVVELAEDVEPTRPFTPTRGGSILWREEITVGLQGDSGLLPMAAVSFGEAGLPAGAAWYLSLDSGAWEWPALGSLIVLLNIDNKAIGAAMDAPDSPAAQTLMDTLEVDFVTDLVGRALDDASFVESLEGIDYADEEFSVGALVRGLVRSRLCLPTETLDEAVARLGDLRRGDPSRYRAFVQDRCAYPRSAAP